MFLMLDLQQPADEATVENFVYHQSMCNLSKQNTLDSINGRKIRHMLVNVDITRAEVGETSKKGEPLF